VYVGVTATGHNLVTPEQPSGMSFASIANRASHFF